MGEWMKVGVSVGVGGAGGAIDQIVQNADQKREEAAAAPLGIMSQYGTYYNYGVPILAIVGSAFGFLKGDMATRLITMGSTLAGRKVTWQITKRGASPWMRSRQTDTRKQIEARRKAAAQVGTGNELTIPVISEETILV
ncbi:hypothetical protein ES703_22501 [subsurface metagenome]